jgi:hypothetical protein
VLHPDPWLIEKVSDIRIHEALRDAETHRLLHQARRVPDGWPWRQVDRLGRQLGYLLVDLGVGLIQRALYQPFPAAGQTSTDPCGGASL